MRLRGNRALLNLPGHHSTAAIVCEIEDTTDRPPRKDWNPVPDVEFKISDCARTVTLDLEVDSEDSFQNSIHKLNVMIHVLREGKKALRIERRNYLKRDKHVVPDAEDDL